MVVFNRKTDEFTQCSHVDAAKIMGVSVRTLFRWQNEKGFKRKTVGEITAIFGGVRKIKQKKGFNYS